MAPHPGGGGLVILPHKSWNVWNQDNKAKVAADEQANAELISAKQQCRKQILQEIRFERLNGEQISKQEEEKRIQHALDTININDYIKDDTMRNIAKNINDKQQREEMKSNKNKRKLTDIHLSEEQIKYGPRKRHKRNDVFIIEDHYNNKTQFEFDPQQYNTVNNNKNIHKNIDKICNNNNNKHFSLFNEGDLQSKYNENGYKNQERIIEEKHAKVQEDRQYKLGKTEIEQRRHKKPWYLMTNKREMDRRMLMKSDSIQHSLPKKFKDYNKNTNELKIKVINRQNKHDPMNIMNEYIEKQKGIDKEVESVCTERDNIEFYEALKRRRDRKKKKKKRDKYNSDSEVYDSERKKRKKKKKK
eukprot:484887_1